MRKHDHTMVPSTRWSIARWVAVASLGLIIAAWIGSLFWLWTLTVGAPVGWRFRTLLPNTLLVQGLLTWHWMPTPA